MFFNQFQINKFILKAVLEKKYITPTLIQEKAIPIILDKKDLIATAQTGTGKTAAFALPILQLLFDKQDSKKNKKKIRALIISPTRELSIQINKDFSLFSKYTNLRSSVIFGGVSIEPQKEILKKGIDILIATPGRLLDLHKQDLVNLNHVEIFVLDEADLMLDMGFINDVKKIARLCPKNKQTVLFSATIPLKVIDLADTLLEKPENVKINPLITTVKKINQYLYYVPKSKKIELCLYVLRNTIKGRVLIFRRTKFGVDKLEKILINKGYKVASIHGDKSQKARQEALDLFKQKQKTILIATDVASRGIDIKNLEAVINFDIPSKPEIYVHRIGRTGRANLSGDSYSFCSADEKMYIINIEKLTKKTISIINNHPYLLDAKTKPEVHKKKGSKYKKGRKSEASKKKKKRWY